jgi:predicted ester cyclase
MKKTLLSMLTILLFLGVSCNTCPEKEELDKMKAQEQVEEQNKELAERWHSDLGLNRKWEVADEILAADIVLHMPGMEELKGIDAVKSFDEMYAAFKNGEVNHYEIVAEGDYVFIRWDLSFDNTVDLMGIPATGKRISGVGGMDQFLIKDGKIQEFWQFYDEMGFMKQLGVIPSE